MGPNGQRGGKPKESFFPDKGDIKVLRWGRTCWHMLGIFFHCENAFMVVSAQHVMSGQGEQAHTQGHVLSQ